MDYRDYDTRLAAYAVLVEDGRVLLALWNGTAQPLWTMPGGGVELEETPAQAAVRELGEETGYEVELTRVLGIDTELMAAEHRFNRDGRMLKNVRVVYEGHRVGGQLRHEVGGSTDEARWVPLGEVAALPRVELVDAALALWRERR